jgi:hypothetical protein
MTLQVVSILRNYPSVRDAFMKELHRAPYFLRYVPHDELLMICITERSDVRNPIVQECNGLVLEKDTFRVISMGMSAVIRTSQEDLASAACNHLQNNHGLSDEDIASLPAINEYMTIEGAEDGTVLRVFSYNDHWFMTSARKMDARRLHWVSSKSFWELFAEAAGVPSDNLESVFEEHLDKNLTYSFVLLHPENRHVIVHDKPTLVLVNVRDNSTLKEQSGTVVSFAQLPTRLDSFFDVPEHKRGVILTLIHKDGARIRLLCDRSDFVRAEALRANMPSFDLSYIAACTEEERSAFRSVFPEFTQQADALDKTMEKLVRGLFFLYRRTFISKLERNVEKDDPLYRLLGSLHYLYKSRDPRTPIVNADVESVIRQLDPRTIASLLVDVPRVIDLSRHRTK